MDDAIDDADGATFGDDSAPVGGNAPLTFVLGPGAAAGEGFALVSDSADTTGFVLGAHAVAAVNTAFNEFVQWQSGGVNLGAPDVRTLNFVDPLGFLLEVTRGVGEHSNVVTVRLKRQYAYFTSILYPLLVDDAMHVGVVPLRSGSTQQITLDTLSAPVPNLQSGTLTASISFVIYTNWRDINPETLSAPVPHLQSGTLIVTITYNNYVNWRDINPETLSAPVPTLQSGTLVVTITFITYTNWRDVNPETLSVPVPTLRSGSLV